ncbi:MAG TPA: exodeoxyribonuclease V subunit alpha [Polyangiales bacterium]|nr:exodeoxyribonuclease V subunit alpha [Polyangiales bacterium]
MSAIEQLIGTLRTERLLSALDDQLGRSLCALAGETSEEVWLAIALLSRHVAAGHVCLPLSELAKPELLLGAEHPELSAAWPQLSSWTGALEQSRLCDPREPTSPLILDRAGRLFFRRHFASEQTLADMLRTRAARTLPADEARVKARLAHHFNSTDPSDLQRRAAELATRRALCVISGGPGTGKTSTVVRILAAVLEEALASGAVAPRIALTAPTGKAAVRLQAAVLKEKQRLDCEPSVLAAIPETASTIHRLLAQAAQRDRSEVSVQPELLPVDLLLVDEASMVNLELMSQLLAALPEHARVILLGDRDQLASVEAGAVLGDICAVTQSPVKSELAQCIVQLTRSYRYGADSGIGQLARAVQAGDAARALEVLDDPQYPDVSLREVKGPILEPTAELASAVLAGYRPYLAALASNEPAEALRLFDGFRVLCAHRQGERGVVALNREIARLLAREDLVAVSEGQFIGRPIMITENDYRTQLWNGDVGVIAAERGTRIAYFLSVEGEPRRMGLGRLPPHESGFALSVHKSQGSEVDVVSLVLPAEPSRILSRELVYTALTRAKKSLAIYGSRDVLKAAIEQAVSRNTGLQDLLR